MSSLDKVLSLAGPEPAEQEDPAGWLVQAALSALTELKVSLAADDDESDDGSGESDGGGHSSHGKYKALIKKGMNAKMAAAMCAKSDKKVAASALCEGAIVALDGLAAAAGDWVEATAFDPLAVSLAGDAKKPYGDVAYADPGYQADGKKRYPIDTEAHVRAALSYISQKAHAAKYGKNLGKVVAKIKSAARKFGIQVAEDSAA